MITNEINLVNNSDRNKQKICKIMEIFIKIYIYHFINRML